MGAEPYGSHEEETTLLPPFSSSNTSTESPKTLEKLQRNIDFYRTYDVMTGVRIAATLGGFFGLMVILVLYKSKSKTERALEDPDFTAAAVAEVEEEERQIAAVLEASAYQELNPRRMRRSLDTPNMPPGWIKTATRFSSVGGYSSLMEPPIRTHSRLPDFICEDSPPDEDRSLYDDIIYCHGHLDVPERRPSNITCSSSGSSYLERRDSAVALGLPVLPAHKSKGHRRQSSPLLEIYDFYYPIDIKVIQPTPGGSPSSSSRAIYDRVREPPHLGPRMAPLASISSCNSSLGSDYPEFDVASCCSDSVFHEDDEKDTDDEVDQFSTDSDEGAACYSGGLRRNQRLSSPESLTSTPINEIPPGVPSTSTGITNMRYSKSSSTIVGRDNSALEMALRDVARHPSTSTSSIFIDEAGAQETLF